MFDGADADKTMDEASAVIVVAADPLKIGTIIEANANACRLFGRSKADMCGQNGELVKQVFTRPRQQHIFLLNTKELRFL